MFNITLNPLRRFGYDTAEREVELTHGRNIHELRLRLTATVSIGAGAAAPTIVQDGVARLIRSLRVNHDGFDYVEPIGGRDLQYLMARCFPQTVAPTTLATADAGTYPIAIDLVIPFTWQYLADPYDVFLAAMPVAQQLKLFVQLEDARTTAASSPGSAALLTGGDRPITITDFALDVVEFSSTPSGRQPQFLPVITAGGSDQFVTANTELEIELRQSRRLLAQLFQYQNGSALNTQAGIRAITLVASNVRLINGVRFGQLKSIERNAFPAVPAAEVGTLLLNYADNGKIGGALDPKRIGTNPRFLFDVDAPATNPGRIRVVNMELAVRAGITAVQTP